MTNQEKFKLINKMLQFVGVHLHGEDVSPELSWDKLFGKHYLEGVVLIIDYTPKDGGSDIRMVSRNPDLQITYLTVDELNDIIALDDILREFDDLGRSKLQELETQATNLQKSLGEITDILYGGGID